jgi:hypothetical protein
VLKHRDFNYQKDQSAGKVVMSYPHLRRFVEGLHDALEMVRDECFEEVGDAYQLTDKGLNSSIHIPDLFAGASVAFEPVICEFQSDDDQVEGEEPDYSGEPGMRIYLNSTDMYADVTLDVFATFVEFYDRFDLFATSRAAVQIAVIQMGGIPGVTMSRTAAPQPTRRTAGAASGLGVKKK